MRTSRKAIWSMIALAVVVLATGAWLLRGPRPIVVPLKDGRVMEVAGITSGTNHSLGGPQLLKRFVPPFFRRPFGPVFSPTHLNQSGLILWLMFENPSNRIHAQTWPGKCVLVDEHGCEFKSSFIRTARDGHFEAEVVTFLNYPRREKSFTCRIFDGNGAVLAEFPIANPDVSRAPVWEPEPLPVTKTNGPFVLTIKGFYPSGGLRLALRRSGENLDLPWGFSFRFEDSAGNHGRQLCQREKAWKWTVRFYRPPRAVFSPDEIVTLTNLHAPASGATTSIAAQVEIHTNIITNFHLAGPGRHDFSNGVAVASAPWTAGMSEDDNLSLRDTGNSVAVEFYSRTSESPFLILPKFNLPENARLTIRARRNDEILGTGEFTFSLREFSIYSLPRELAGKTFDLDFIIDPGVEFTALLDPALRQ